MRMLLTAGRGQLGFELARSLAVLGELTVLDRDSLDLADEPAVRGALQRCGPT